MVDEQCQIVQVLDETKALINLYYYQHGIIDADNCKKTLVCIEFSSTAHLIDNRLYHTGDQRFEVVGTFKYDSAAGPRTVPLLKEIGNEK